MAKKAEIMDALSMDRTVKRMAHEIIEAQEEGYATCMIGIQRRGVTLSRRIAEYILEFEGLSLPLGALDITFYRDDLSILCDHPVLNSTDIPFDINNKNIVLIDDVLFTGRTIRAAMEALFELGRPKFIKLAVLIDRGHRELPIRADFVGKNVPTSSSEMIDVKVMELDGADGVDIIDKKEAGK